jgi:hypothetical protein
MVYYSKSRLKLGENPSILGVNLDSENYSTSRWSLCIKVFYSINLALGEVGNLA